MWCMEKVKSILIWNLLFQITKILYKITKYGYRLAFFNLGVYHIYKVTKELQKYLIVIHYETVPVFPIINT